MNTMFSNARCGRNALTSVAFLALGVFSAKPQSIFERRKAAAKSQHKFSNAPGFIEAREKIEEILQEAITNMEDQIHHEKIEGLLTSEKDVRKRWLELLNDNKYGQLRDIHYSLIYKKFNTGDLEPKCIADEFLKPVLVRSRRRKRISRQGRDDEASHPLSDHEIERKLRRVKRQDQQFRDRKIQKQRKAIFKEFRKTFISRLESASPLPSRTTNFRDMQEDMPMITFQKIKAKSARKQKKKQRHQDNINQQKTESGSYMPLRELSGDVGGDCYNITNQMSSSIVGLPADDIIHLENADKRKLENIGRIPPPKWEIPPVNRVKACRADPDEILFLETECPSDDDHAQSNSTTKAQRKLTPEEMHKMRLRRRNRDIQQLHSDSSTALEIKSELLRVWSDAGSGENASEPRERIGRKKTKKQLKELYGKPPAAEDSPTIV